MSLAKIKTGKNVPNDINVIIEIPKNGTVKYEIDKDSGLVTVDRILNASMHYPMNYGFIPHTLSDDGDPLDAFVYSDAELAPGSVINCRPIGVFYMKDQAGIDEKIICLPSKKVDPTDEDLIDIDQTRPLFREKIQHFFEHYKDLEEGKWVKTKGWGNKKESENVILECIQRYKDVCKTGDKSKSEKCK